MRLWVLLFTSAVVCSTTGPAAALSWSVQMNCASDYYAYCSKHVAGSAGCHACMRANRLKLSSACVSALIDDGIIPKTNITQQKAKFAATKPRPAQSVKAVTETKPAAKPRAAKVAIVQQPAARPAQKPVPAALEIDRSMAQNFI